MRRILIQASMMILGAVWANSRELEITSGEDAVPLLELFTSEGCSSCPPAEEWFSRLATSPALWKRFVPAAFHVDYWNHLGWTDPYSSTAWSERQRNLSQLMLSRSVYTPEFFLNGREWRIGENIAPQSKGGILRITIRGDGGLDAVYSPVRQSSGPYLLNVAPMACGLSQMVPRGENSGRTLQHDFVVLTVVRIPMASDSKSKFTAKTSIPKDVAAKMQAVAAWVSNRDNPTPIQATGGWTK